MTLVRVALKVNFPAIGTEYQPSYQVTACAILKMPRGYALK